VPRVRRPYVVVCLQGGLGNQLFQYASGLGIATALGAELRFDSFELRPDEHWLPDLVGSDYRAATTRDLVGVGVLHGGTGLAEKLARNLLRDGVDLGRRARRLSPRVEPRSSAVDRVAAFDEQILRADPPVYLQGYFQTERWFDNVAGHVARQLAVPAVEAPRPVPGRPVVAVSFRRGDYVRFGWQLPLSYYERALTRMLVEVPDATFLVLGDDPEFVRFATAWVAGYGPAASAYDHGAGELIHLALGAACDHAVLANSTFAWWGAWIGDQRANGARRVVVAPQDYPNRFGPDILRPSWISITSS